MTLCVKGMVSGVSGTLGPYASLLTKRWSPAVSYEVSIAEAPVDGYEGWNAKYTAFPYTTSELQQTSIQQNPGW